MPQLKPKVPHSPPKKRRFLYVSIGALIAVLLGDHTQLASLAREVLLSL